MDPIILHFSTTYSEHIHSPTALFRGTNPGNLCVADWIDPGVGLTVLEKRKISFPCWASNHSCWLFQPIAYPLY